MTTLAVKTLKHSKAKRGGIIRWFRQVGWKHLIGLFVIAFSTFPLLYILSTSLTQMGNIENYTLFRQFYLGNYTDLLQSSDYPFVIWMKNTLIGLDILFFDSAGRLVNIRADAIPGDETPLRSTGPAQYVLEINAGLASALKMGPDTVLSHARLAGDEKTPGCV